MVEQQQIPGTEDKEHPKVSAAAKEYVAIRDERMALTKREVEAKTRLLEICRQEGIERYVIEGGEHEVVHEVSENVKVRRVRGGSEGGDESEEG